MTNTAILFDCEYLCAEGSQRRSWCGADDPDPVIAQIGAVKLELDGNYPLLETYRTYIQPRDRFGNRIKLDPFFTKLTGITETVIQSQGVGLAEALEDFMRFANGARLWSWGKDEFNMVAISCYVAGIPCAIPADRFDNAVKLLIAAGMPAEDAAMTSSSGLADYVGAAHPPLRGHDALDDARSLAYALQHLLQTGKLGTAHFRSI